MPVEGGVGAFDSGSEGETGEADAPRWAGGIKVVVAGFCGKRKGEGKEDSWNSRPLQGNKMSTDVDNNAGKGKKWESERFLRTYC